MRTLATLTLAIAFSLAGGAWSVSHAKDAGEDKTVQAIDDMIKKANVDKAKPGWRTSLPKPEKAQFEAGKSYFAKMETTKGPVRIKLLPDVAPMHVTSFIYLTRLGFYDGLAFHRVIPGFMAQGGCPLGSGTGGPGYEYGGEFSPNVKHDQPGMLSMANRGPNTDGSQFFLTFAATPWLDGKHTIYGKVVDGMDTLKALEKVGSQSGRTSEPVKIDKVTIEIE
jgi:cyclophilin family peptidyl-prolyl cis-trans isomerase